MRMLARFLGFVFATATILFLIGSVAVAGLVYYFSKDLPDTEQLRNYEPPVTTRLHAGDGSILAEYSHERRLFLPSSAIPQLVKQAFISAEDKNFYNHIGIDPEGVMRAVTVLAQGGRHVQGASTITQQVAKNFLVGNERSIERKVREALVAFRIEAAYPKDKILELYLNEIYLGLGNYGVAAAALNYFNKSVNELTLAEAAYLAALPKAPSNYHPFQNRERALERRNYVIDRLIADGYVTAEEGAKAKAEPLGVNPRVLSPNTYVAGYFAEEVRRQLLEQYSEKKLYEGGLSVRTTLDPKMQAWTRKALADGLVRFDEAHGFRGAMNHIDISSDWGVTLATIPALGDVKPWRLAVVLDVTGDAARIGLQLGREKSGEVARERETGLLTAEGMRWAGRNPRTAFTPGDVVYVEPLAGRAGQYRLRQIPDISGAMVAMDPHTGRVFSMVGGFSFDQSAFNRSTQALRQPGSSFKPIVYAAALESGYTPASTVLDAPITLKGYGGQDWSPENYSRDYYGALTLRRGLELSRNTMTVRLAQSVGMTKISDLAVRLGVTKKMDKVLAMALGSGETTVFRMAGAYSTFVNGGKLVTPHLIETVEDRNGKVIWRADRRDCDRCGAPFTGDAESPRIPRSGDQVMDPITAYQITSFLEGVVQRGTATQASSIGKPLGGKTGTTNDYRSAWFMGFSPKLVVGVYIGFDDNRSLGNNETGSVAAVPIFTEFMGKALKDKPAEPFKAPANAKYAMIRGIREAFRPGTEPQGPAAGMGAAATPSGPQPYNKVWQDGITGAPNAGAAVAPPPPPPPKKKDDLSDLF